MHLAIKNASTMVVMWVTKDKANSTAFVQWGSQPSIYTNNATAVVYTYHAGTLGMARASDRASETLIRAPYQSRDHDADVRRMSGWEGWIYKTYITGLAPDTRYFYRVGSASYWSQEFNFTSVPPSPCPRPLRFAVFGDMGTGITLLMSRCCASARSAAS